MPPTPDRLHTLEDDVVRGLAVLDRMRRSGAPLAELRAQHLAVTAALDAAIDAAAAAGARQRLHRLRTQRELHVLAGLSTPGVRVPTVVRTTSREATAPHIAGMHLDPTAALGAAETRSYGVDLVTVLRGDPLTMPAPPAGPAHELPVQRGPQQPSTEDARDRQSVVA